HRARPGGDHLAEERTLHRLDLALSVTGVAGLGRRPVGTTGTTTQITQDRRVHGDLLVDSRGTLLQRQPDPDEGVGTGLHPAARPTTAAATTAASAEEGVHDVAEPAESRERVAAATAASTARTTVHRVTAEIDDATFLRIGQYLVGGGDLAETLLSVRGRVDIRA